MLYKKEKTECCITHKEVEVNKDCLNCEWVYIKVENGKLVPMVCQYGDC